MLEAVILESLRLQPPAYLVGRCAATSQQMGPFRIAAGALPGLAVAPACKWCWEQHMPAPETDRL